MWRAATTDVPLRRCGSGRSHDTEHVLAFLTVLHTYRLEILLSFIPIYEYLLDYNKLTLHDIHTEK